jgi:hypothetical protein
MRKTNLLPCAALMLPLLTQAAEVTAPSLAPGDTWSYTETLETAPNGWQQTRETFSVTRITSDHIYFQLQQTGANQAAKEVIAGPDWSRWRNVNGTQTMVNQPVRFPLEAGKHWEIKFTEAHPTPKISTADFDDRYKVVGIEPIEVPAGKFQAWKIEAEGSWTAQSAPGVSATTGTEANQAGTTVLMQTHNNQPTTVTGSTYKAFWYVPEIGRWVKSIEETYGANGMRTRRLSVELDAYKRAGQAESAVAAMPASTSASAQ